MNNWFVYIVECSDGSWYTGITTDVEKRVTAHNHPSKGAKYTRTRQPVKLLWSEGGFTRSTASKEEYKIKKLSKKSKRDYIYKNRD